MNRSLIPYRLCSNLLLACLMACLLTHGTDLSAGNRVTLRIRFGMKDQQPTDWSGRLSLPSGNVESIRGWRWTNGDSARGNQWTVKTRRRRPQSSADRKRIAAGIPMPMTDNGIIVKLVDCDEDRPIEFRSTPYTGTFRLSQLLMGKKMWRADGNVTIERVPTVLPLATTSADEDYPAAAIGPDGTIYVVYVAFHRGRDFQGFRERVATEKSGPLQTGNTPVRFIGQPADLVYLAQPTGGEQLIMRVRRNGVWGDPIPLTERSLEIYRPSITVDGDGHVWVFYSAHLDPDEHLDYGNWEVLAQRCRPDGTPSGKPINVSRADGTDFMPAATSDSQGRAWITWVGARGSRFHVWLAHETKTGFSAPERVSELDGNEWEPAIAADRHGNLAVSWDTFDKGDYDVYVSVRNQDGQFGAPEVVAGTLAFEVRPSLTYDRDQRLWIAYEYSGDQWGKDFGALKKKGIPLYQTGRSLAVRVRDTAGKWYQPADVMASLSGGTLARNRNPNTPAKSSGNQAAGPRQPRRQPRRSPVRTIAPTYPRLACDRSGNIWLAFRGKPGSNWRVRVGTVWCEYITRLDSRGWSPAAWVPHSNNILDNRPALVVTGNEDVMAVFSADGRGEVNPLTIEDVHLRGTNDHAQPQSTKKQRGKQRTANRDPNRIDPNNHVLTSRISGSEFGAGGVGSIQLTPVARPALSVAAVDVAAERKDIQRMRDYRVQLGNETLRIWRGEFHRHTELSPDGGGDGGLLDMWRYAIDAAGMDWIGDGDHDYGNGREYSWWTTQKAVTLFTLPGHFVPVYSYERSVRYPEGHRNCMFAYRGVRSLPRLPISSPDHFAPAPDTELLYMYLHFFKGLCASHTSATDMGTDWRNHDPIVEPFVEIYQGDRNNYERPDAPRSAVTEAKLKQSTPEKESIGGWRPKGFVNLALLKGYRLAFQASSDHISTHLSYCNVFVTEPTREGILDAIRKRRVYGATDNIIADVRCRVGNQVHFMGEEFSTSQAPTLDIRIIGAQKIAKVTIIKDDKVVYEATPGKRDVRFQWTDPKPSVGHTSYYYVRGEQEPDLEGASSGELVWASPMWIRVEGTGGASK